MNCTDGPWVLFTLRDGRRWLFTADEDYSVDEAIHTGAMRAPGEAVAVELLPSDYACLLKEVGPLVRWLNNGNVEMKTAPYGDVVEVGALR